MGIISQLVVFDQSIIWEEKVIKVFKWLDTIWMRPEVSTGIAKPKVALSFVAPI